MTGDAYSAAMGRPARRQPVRFFVLSIRPSVAAFWPPQPYWSARE